MFRRRPLARAAVVGGAAYAVGRRGGRIRAEEEMAQYEQQDTGLPDTAYAELVQLGKLKDDGILTEAEFEVQKAKILAGG